MAKKFLKSVNIGPAKFERATGFRYRHYRKKEDTDIQVYKIIKICHLLGISLDDFMGNRSFSELVARGQINLERMPDERIQQIIETIKHNIDQRRKTLNISTPDLAIMLGISDEQRMINSLLNPLVISFPWYRYFQLSEILAREGEDDLFLLDEVTF